MTSGLRVGKQPRTGSGEATNKMLPCLMPLPREIAEKGDGIYKAKYKRIYEKRFFGQYVAIDLETGEAFVAPNAAAAIQSAQTTSKEGALFPFDQDRQPDWRKFKMTPLPTCER